MNYLVYMILFLLGSAVGSFLNVLIDCLPFDKKFINRRSVCDHCHKILSPIDLIPVFSYLFLFGKCRFCGKKINIQYPLVELTTGLLFLFSFHYYFSITSYVLALIIISLSVAIFMIDLKYSLVLDALSYPAIFFALGYTIFNNLQDPRIILNNVLGSLLAGLFFWFLWAVTKGKGMGEGDILIAIFIGLLTGYPVILVALLIAFLTGSLVGVILILLGRKKMKSEIAFGPFLIAGAYLALIFFKDAINFWTFPFVK